MYSNNVYLQPGPCRSCGYFVIFDEALVQNSKAHVSRCHKTLAIIIERHCGHKSQVRSSGWGMIDTDFARVTFLCSP